MLTSPPFLLSFTFFVSAAFLLPLLWRREGGQILLDRCRTSVSRAVFLSFFSLFPWSHTVVSLSIPCNGPDMLSQWWISLKDRFLIFFSPLLLFLRNTRASWITAPHTHFFYSRLAGTLHNAGAAANVHNCMLHFFFSSPLGLLHSSQLACLLQCHSSWNKSFKKFSARNWDPLATLRVQFIDPVLGGSLYSLLHDFTRKGSSSAAAVPVPHWVRDLKSCSCLQTVRACL